MYDSALFYLFFSDLIYRPFIVKSVAFCFALVAGSLSENMRTISLLLKRCVIIRLDHLMNASRKEKMFHHVILQLEAKLLCHLYAGALISNI